MERVMFVAVMTQAVAVIALAVWVVWTNPCSGS